MPSPETPRRLLVNSRRNSACAFSLSLLDWQRWWTDQGTFAPGLYLHVYDLEGDGIHKVYCKHSDFPRLRFENGQLYWLVDA